MFSVVCGINHPRLCEDISHKNFEFFDIGNYKSDTVILINLMKEVLDNKSNNNIVQVFEDFFESRTITNDDSNIFYQRILSFFVEYNKWYNGKKATAVKFYLVKRDVEENKVTDVLVSWKAFREQEKFVSKIKKKKKTKSFKV
jgi:hypothetical protein